MNKQLAVNTLLTSINPTTTDKAIAYAPSNIALAKYWGKRDEELNLPITSSLSISLANYGTTTEIMQNRQHDEFYLNGVAIDPTSEFSIRLSTFLDLFRPTSTFYFTVNTQSTVPIAAGVASSASGFAAITLALNDLFAWNLSKPKLSLLARLGSGSACRSLWHGFVQWDAGDREDGMDSVAHPLEYRWEKLRVGLLLFNSQKKAISSRVAMQQTVNTSPFYREWPLQVADTLRQLHQALAARDFAQLGLAAETNALAMHATMLTAQPSICYWQPETVLAMQQVWKLRAQGLPIYFTEDAGANLKLLFLQENSEIIKSFFPEMIIIDPWNQSLI